MTGRDDTGASADVTVGGAVSRRRAPVAAIVALGVAVGIVLAILGYGGYEASAELVVRPELSPVFDGTVARDAASYERYATTQVGLLQSPLVVRMMLEEMQQDGFLEGAAVSDVTEDLSVTKVEDADLVRVEYRHEVSRTAVLGANRLVQAYQAIRADHVMERARVVASGFDAAIADIDDQLSALAPPQGLPDAEAEAAARTREALLERRALLESRKDAMLVEAAVAASDVEFTSFAREAERESVAPAVRTIVAALLVSLLVGAGVAYWLEARSRPVGGSEGRSTASTRTGG